MTDKDHTHQNRSAQCAFCGRSRDQVEKLIAGPGGVSICSACVAVAHSMIAGEAESVPDAAESPKKKALLKPVEIKKALDDYIIGQELAKKKISVAIYNHAKKIRHQSKGDGDVEIAKSNILLIGPTGTGKTLMAQTLARLLSVPFAIADATTLTEAGYVGEDVENVIVKLFQAAKGNIGQTQKGIIYIDEIDKIGRKSDNPSITRDVSGEGVQQALLKIIEGTVANIPPQGGRKHPYQEFVPIDTTDILFIFGGAFIGLDKIIAQRLGKSTVGFKSEHKTRPGQSTEEIFRHLIPQDLIRFGMIPELIGRIPVMAVFSDLGIQDLVDILVKPKNALIRQYQKLFEMEGVELSFTRDALKLIAAKSLERGLGARGLRTIIEDLMLDLMFNLPSSKKAPSIEITKKMVEENELNYEDFKPAIGA